jgi:hypothetical protein
MSLDILATRFIGSAPSHHSRSHLATENAIGIELEYEQATLPETWDLNYWVAVADGSLRNRGVEFVSNPLSFGEVEAALCEAEAIVRDVGAIATERCGLHTHMNMRPYTVGQVWSLATLYALIEPTLYQTYAIGREDSMFAVPLWLNTRQVRDLAVDITNLRCARPDSTPRSTTIQMNKYSALNFASMLRFGTLEMRQPYCSNDFNAIRSWMDFCIRLVEIGTSYEDPNEVIAHYERNELIGIQERMFGLSLPIDPDIQEQADDAAYLLTGEERL